MTLRISRWAQTRSAPRSVAPAAVAIEARLVQVGAKAPAHARFDFEMADDFNAETMSDAFMVT